MAETIPFPGARDVEISASDIPLKGSEDEFAHVFSNQHEDTLRYVNLWGRWLRWDGSRWEFETTLAAFHLARLVAREIANTSEEPAFAKASVVAAIEHLARADRRHASTTEQWDNDQTLFNLKRGD
jgi:putative DNA primase/helicase